MIYGLQVFVSISVFAVLVLALLWIVVFVLAHGWYSGKVRGTYSGEQTVEFYRKRATS